MRTGATILAGVATAAAVALTLVGAGAQARDITLTGDPWPPYVNGEIGGEAQDGIAVRLARHIFARIEGVTPRFPLIPWERALREVEAGTMDGIVILAKTPERERYMVYTEPLITARSLVWYDARRFPAGFEWSSFGDLAPHLIGAVRGYDYGPDIERGAAAGRLNLVQVNAVGQLFAMLARGRVELALANDSVGYGLARRHAGEADIRPASKATGTDVYYMAFSLRSDAATLVKQVNETIAELRREGVLQALSRGE